MITQSRHGRVVQITLNRPEKRNALNIEMSRQLVYAFDNADIDHSVGAILLTANGPTFCAGMDLNESVEVDQRELARIHERLFSTIQRVRTPIVSAIQGSAFAGGVGLVANTHIAVAAKDARFGLTEIRIGLWPMLIFRAMQAAIGERRMVELSLTGREFSAAEGVEYGLVTEVAADPVVRAMELAQQISSFSPIAIGRGLDYVQQSRGQDWDEAGNIGRKVRTHLIEGRDFQEGVKAFTEKRKPVWPSHEG